MIDILHTTFSNAILWKKLPYFDSDVIEFCSLDYIWRWDSIDLGDDLVRGGRRAYLNQWRFNACMHHRDPFY